METFKMMSDQETLPVSLQKLTAQVEIVIKDYLPKIDPDVKDKLFCYLIGLSDKITFLEKYLISNSDYRKNKHLLIDAEDDLLDKEIVVVEYDLELLRRSYNTWTSIYHLQMINLTSPMATRLEELMSAIQQSLDKKDDKLKSLKKETSA